jgi:D-ribose pyranase
VKKTPLLNVALSRIVAGLGHGDLLVVGDAGLPVPRGVELVDLAVTRGVPGFLDTLGAVLTEMQVEAHWLAAETEERSPEIWSAVARLGLPRRQVVTHEELKRLCQGARAVVRTGEFTPYANVVLGAGVVF